MTLPLWILPRSKKSARKAERKTLLSVESLETRLVPTIDLPDLATITGAPTSSTVDTWTTLDGYGIEPLVDGSTDSSSPMISEWTHTAAPGESIVVTGANFDSSTEFWVYGQTGSTATSLLMANVQNVDTTTHQAQITLPASLTENSMYTLWAKNGSHASQAVTINQTEAKWAIADAANPNTTFSIYGQNLTYDAGEWTTGSAPVSVYIRQTGTTGQFKKATVTAANSYRVTFNVPSGTSAANYDVWITNGHGAEYGWSKLPDPITVGSALSPNGIDVYSTNTSSDWTDKLILNTASGTASANGGHNSAVLTALFNANSDNYLDGDSQVTVINLPEGTFPIYSLISITSNRGTGKNIKLVGHEGGTTLKWVGASGGYMFNNNYTYGIENYTFENITIDSGATLDTDPDSDSNTDDGRYVGGATPFLLGNPVTNVHFNDVTIYAPSTAGISITPYDSTRSNKYDGVYITGSTITAWKNEFVHGTNLFIDHTTFYQTNDSWYAIYTQDSRNVNITENIALSYFAKLYKDAHGVYPPDAATVDGFRNSGANWGRRFYWGGYLGANTYLWKNTSSYLGIRITGTVAARDYDIAGRRFDGSGAFLGYGTQGSYDQNTGEQYAWDGKDLGFQDTPTSSSGTSLQFNHSDVPSLPGGTGAFEYLKYDATDGRYEFAAVVVAGAGAGQIRHIIGYSSGGTYDTFTLDSAFDVPLSLSGSDASVIVVTPLFENVVMYKNEIIGIPGNKDKISSVEGDFGIFLFLNTVNFVVDDNTISGMRWSVALDAVAAPTGSTGFQHSGVASNNLIVNNHISDTRRGIVVEVQTSGAGSAPAGAFTSAFGNIIRGNDVTGVSEAGITFMYNRSNESWLSNQQIVTNIFESNTITLGDAAGIVNAPQPIGVDLDFGYSPGGGISSTHYAPVKGLFLYKNSITNTLTPPSGASTPSSIGLRVGLGSLASSGSTTIPQQVVLSGNDFSGFATVYATASSASATILPWDGEILAGVFGTSGHYKFFFREKNASAIPTAHFRYEFDMDGDGIFDSTHTDSSDQEVGITQDSFPEHLRIRITNLYSSSSVIYELSNDADEESIFYVGSTVDDSPTFTTLSGGDVRATWGGSTHDFLQIDNRIWAIGGAGNDIMNASGITSGPTVLLLGDGDNDSLTGGAMDDVAIGGYGNDTMIGGGGNDTLIGELGEDKYSYSGSSSLGSDLIIGNATDGTDTLDFSGMTSGIAVSLGSTSAQTLNGSLSLTLFANNIVENIIGSSGNDSLTGNALDNVILGGPGNDTLAGASGSDTYIYSGTGLGSDTINEDSAADSDTLDLSGLTSAITINLSSTSSQTLNAEASITLNHNDGLENVIGTSGNDSITGNANSNFIVGLGGNDTLLGGDNDDILFGGDGNDSISGEAGNDSLVGDDIELGSVAFIFTGNGADTIDGGVGDDLIVGGAGADNITGGDGADYLIGDEGVVYSIDSSVRLETFNDTVSGKYAADTIYGNAGNDSIAGGGGNDSINGGDDNDLILGDGGVISGGIVVDSLAAGTGDDSISGGAGSDTIKGGTGNDTYLFTGSSSLGTDTINEVSSADSDTLDFSGMSSAITVDLTSTTTQTVNGNISILLDHNDGIENVLGSNSGDTITGNSRANSLTGNDGNDSITGGDGNDTLVGSAGDDTLAGEAGNDTYAFSGGSSLGTDRINETSATATDVLDFGGMSSAISVNLGTASTNQTVNGSLTLYLDHSDGIENVIGSSGNDTITGNSRDNYLAGKDGADTISGSSGDDSLEGGAGNDSLTGGSDDDTYIYSGNSNLGTDTIIEASASDSDTLDFSALVPAITVDLGTAGTTQVVNSLVTLYLDHSDGIEGVLGTSDSDTITGNGRANILKGNGDDDSIDGGSGNDSIFGGIGNDTLDGGNDDDTLIGDDGVIVSGVVVDSLLSGSGEDLLSGDAGNDLLYGVGGNDWINGDTVTISGATFTFLGDGWDTIYGGLGNDQISGGDGQDSLMGEGGNDFIFGSNFTIALTTGVVFQSTGSDDSNEIYGGSDNDSIVGGAADDQLNGGDGDDTLLGDDGAFLNGVVVESLLSGSGADFVFGDDGNDLIYGEGGSDGLYGDTVTVSGATFTFGGDGWDTIYGGLGNDQISGGDGQDSLMGEGGNDLIFGSNFTIALTTGVVFQSTGSDDSNEIYGGSGDDSIVGGAAEDRIEGGDGDDTLIGDDGAFLNGVVVESLMSGSGVDYIFGDNDNDLIYGVGGDDGLYGDNFTISGATFTFLGSGWDTIHGGLGNDQISGGDGQDSLMGDGGDDLIFGSNYTIALTTGIVFQSSGSDDGNEIYGGSGNDSIVGGASDDRIEGGDGDDSLIGDDGAFLNGVVVESLMSGSGNDLILGDDDNDLIYGVGGDDGLYGDTVSTSGATFTFLGDGWDTIYGGLGNDQISGGDGQDSLMGDGGNDLIFGSNYTIAFTTGVLIQSSGSDDENEIYGGSGNDSIVGGAADDRIEGGDGDDSLLGDDGAFLNGVVVESLMSGSGADLILGDDGNDLIYGVGGADGLYGDTVTVSGATFTFLGNGWDTIYGGLGNDQISGGDGQDSLMGEGGNDLIFGSNYTIAFTTGVLVQSSGSDDGNEIYGGSGDDSIAGGASGDFIEGGDDNDTILGDDGGFLNGVVVESLMSGSGEDLISGDAGNDLIYGAGGSDWLNGDTLNATSSPFTFAGSGADTVHGGDGADSINGGAGADSITGDAGNDLIFGGNLNFTITTGLLFQSTGTDGNDTLDGGTGNDSILGGAGNDNIKGGDNNDIIIGDDGGLLNGVVVDSLLSGSGDDTISGDAGNDQIYGVGGNDIANGGDGADSLFGGAGSDFLIGGDGADELHGDDGEDLLLSGIITVSSGTYSSFVSSIQAEWLNTSHSYAVRVANISGVGSGTMANGSNYLDGSTVATDAAIDAVYGEASGTGDDADDWFLVDDSTSSYEDTTDIDVLDETLTDIGAF